MNEFTAADGSIVRSDGHPFVMVNSNGMVTHHFSESESQALRQFFRAEDDERLGRWRWPEKPEFVVYAPVDFTHYVRVLNESEATLEVIHRAHLEGRESSMAQAARAYFDAHPESKPWHDAQIGETWVLLGDHLGIAVSVVGGKDERWFTRATVFGKVERYELTDPTIAEARRIWPEAVTS